MDGNTIHSTIDANIQGIVEKYLKQFNDEHKDAVQAYAQVPINVDEMHIDMLLSLIHIFYIKEKFEHSECYWEVVE